MKPDSSIYIRSDSKQYKLQQVLGEGAYGKVFKARVSNSNLSNILKEENLQNNNSNYIKPYQSLSFFKQLNIGNYVAIKQLCFDKNKRQIIERQAQLLHCHRNTSEYIIKFHESFYDFTQKKYYIVMEYLSQGTIQQLIQKHSKNKTKICQVRIYLLILSLTLGLKFLHYQCLKNEKKCIMHKDIKPLNILLNENYSLKIIDFSFSIKVNNDQKQQVQQKCGTRCFSSPQLQSKTQEYSEKAQIYSLGLILYLLLKPQKQLCAIKNKYQQKIQKQDFSQYKYGDFWKKILINTLAYEQKNRFDAKQLEISLRNKDKQFFQPKISIISNEKQTISNQASISTNIYHKKLQKKIKSRQIIEKIMLYLYKQKIDPTLNYVRLQITLLKIISLCFYLNTYNTLTQNFNDKFFSDQHENLQTLFQELKKIIKKMKQQSSLKILHIQEIIPQLQEKQIQNAIFLEDIIKLKYEQNNEQIDQNLSMQNVKQILISLLQRIYQIFQGTLFLEQKWSKYIMSFYLLLQILCESKLKNQTIDRKSTSIKYQKLEQIFKKISNSQLDYSDIQKLKDNLRIQQENRS